MERKIFGQVGKLKPEKAEDYIRLHANPWPGVLKTITRCNLHNYSIFIQDTTVFAYFEYTGNDFGKDMEQMEADEITRQWWKHTKPCFDSFAVSPKSPYYHEMRQIFYYQ